MPFYRHTLLIFYISPFNTVLENINSSIIYLINNAETLLKMYVIRENNNATTRNPVNTTLYLIMVAIDM